MDLSARCLSRLEGVHPALVLVVKQAALITSQPFVITEGLRTIKRQRSLYGQGKSWTLLSKHLIGHAVDVAAISQGKPTWDWPLYTLIADAFKQSASDLGVQVVWGGDWRVRDGTHFELADVYGQALPSTPPQSAQLPS